jgi:hypothetical protein
MTFNPAVFERLLFPLHKEVYRRIQYVLDETEKKHPGQLKRILSIFAEGARMDTQTGVFYPGEVGDTVYPCLDIEIFFNEPADYRLSTLHKSTGFKVACHYDEKPAASFTGSHLHVCYYSHKALNAFIVPLAYLLGCNEKAVLQAGSYQLYSHTILSPENKAVIDREINGNGNKAKDVKTTIQRLYLKNALIYIGITKQTWQERYRQHCRDSGNGSNLLFHRALRGEVSPIASVEHIVERAGLTEKQAMEIEEKEVEKRSLHSLYPNGLNMIPGGYAGLKFIHHFAARTGFAINKELSVDTIETVLAQTDTVRPNLARKRLAHGKNTRLFARAGQ